MVRFNGDVIFVDTSGQVRSRSGDLTLRADDTGAGHIIVGSGVTFRPEADCGSLEPIDLGLDWLRWNTLYACSGNFLERPTVNGSGVLLQGEAVSASVDLSGLCTSGVFTPASGTQFVLEHSLNTEIFIWNMWRNDTDPILSITPVSVSPSGNDHAIIDLAAPISGVVVFACGGPQGVQGPSGVQGLPGGVTTIEGLAGVVDLDSPDESVNISVNGQTIEVTTPGSGAPSGASYTLVDYNDNGHLTDARKLSATSGITVEDQGARSISGLVIKLDFDDEPVVNQLLSWNGQKLAWVDDQAGGGGSKVEMPFSPESGTLFVVEHGINSTAFVWSMWQTHADEQDLDPILSLIPNTVSPSGANHAIISIKEAVSGIVIFVG
ncbi:MAG: hypothetical protein ACXABY_01735 [Candidatus Thorarchaeota archaeon]|jgi:hypothetical protein